MMAGYHDFPILYVHDEPQAATVLRYVLGDDFNVLFARELSDAVELASKHNFALVLCEQVIGGVSGVEICARLRDVQPDVPRVITATHAGRQISVDAVQAGHIVGHVDKPWKHPDFVDLVRAKLDLVRMRESMRSLQTSPPVARSKRFALTLLRSADLEASETDVVQVVRAVATAMQAVALSPCVDVYAKEAVSARIHPSDLAQALFLLLTEYEATPGQSAATLRADVGSSQGRAIIALSGPAHVWAFTATTFGKGPGASDANAALSMAIHLVRRAGGNVSVEGVHDPHDTLVLQLP